MDKIWLASYQKGIPHEININEYASLVALFEESTRKHAEQIAYVNMGHGLTYADIDRLSLQFAIYLQSLGLKQGARVALMMPNVLQYPIALFGTLRAGCVVVNTNPLYTPDEVVHQINDSEADVIVVFANFAQTIEKALPRIHVKHIIITEMGDMFPFMKRVVINAVIKYIKKLVPPYNLPGATAFRDIFKSHNNSFKPVTLNHDSLAFLQYTGGTTGVAKGAMLTHGNMVANVLQAYYWISPLEFGIHDCIITALPLYHIFSLTANCLVFFKMGSKNILITNPRDMKRFINEIKSTKFTAFTGVNTLFNGMLNRPEVQSIDFSALKLSLSGGMALQQSIAIKWRELTNSRILEAYGLTETSPAVTINPLYLTEFNGSIGLPLPSTDISIRNEEGIEVGINEPGELCVKGPQVMAGYWRRDYESADSFTTDHFLKTGDIAKIDEKGFIYLVERKKNLILVSGFNVYPSEIEQVISMMPEVLEVGVIGVTNDASGERVKACVVKRDPTLTEEQVIAYCREHLTAYKIPKIVEFYTELPKTNVGKILHRVLRETPSKLK